MPATSMFGSTMKKILLVLFGTVLFDSVVLAKVLFSELYRKQVISFNSEFNSQESCLDETCMHILEAMDPSIDPCEDFYAYSCNRWIRENPIPNGKTSWTAFDKLRQKNELVIKHVLEQPVDTFKSKAEKKAKLYYDSCLDVNMNIHRLGAKPMLELLDKVGGWNVTKSNFDINKWSLQNSLQIIQNKYSVGALFSYAVDEDDKNSTRHVMQIDQSGLTLPTKHHYLKAEYRKVVEACLDYMVKVGILLGGDPHDTKEQMHLVLEFETKLAKITTPNELKRDEESLYHLMTIKQLQKMAGFIDWRAFFQDAMNLINRKVTSEENVLVKIPEYLSKLTLLIKEYSKTKTGRITLNNYLIWQTIRLYIGSLSRDFSDAFQNLRRVLYGVAGGGEPRWRTCVADATRALGFATGSIFVREVFHVDSKIQAEKMINEIRNSFKKNFQDLDWMDSETTGAAEIKANGIIELIGYPDFIRDQKLLDEWYATLEVKNDTYFYNNVNLRYHNLFKNLEKIDKPVNRSKWSEWNMPPSAVNAYYDPLRNHMGIPAGILQSPFYDPKYPASLNFGGIGVVMGHEITHAFDDQGRKRDKEGNLHQWWGNDTIELFKTRTECFVKQYEKYQINGKHANGSLTLGENMADNGGVKAAYNAYVEYMKDKIEPPPLAGINLTHGQLFFLSFAQVWCSNVTVEHSNLNIATNEHSPNKLRVIATLANLDEFSKEFHCPLGSKMNPIKKCEVW